MYVSMGVGPYIHKYIHKNVTSKPKSPQNVGPNENGPRMYTNMAGSRMYTNMKRPHDSGAF